MACSLSHASARFGMQSLAAASPGRARLLASFLNKAAVAKLTTEAPAAPLPGPATSSCLGAGAASNGGAAPGAPVLDWASMIQSGVPDDVAAWADALGWSATQVGSHL